MAKQRKVLVRMDDIISLLSIYERIDNVLKEHDQVLNEEMFDVELSDLGRVIVDLMGVPEDKVYDRDNLYEIIHSVDAPAPNKYHLLMKSFEEDL